MIQLNVAGAGPVPRFRDAYQTLLDEMHDLAEDDLTTANVDIPKAVTTVLAALPKIRALRPQVMEMTQRYDLERFDKLEAYTLAVAYANSLFLAASQPPESIDALADEAASLRALLVAETTTLAQRRIIDGQRLKDLRGAHGRHNLAVDLFTLASVVRKVWPAIVGKTSLHIAEIDLAETLADKLLTAVGLVEHGPVIVAMAAENRRRAFTLFIKAYDSARRVVHFLRWNEGDADDIAPSLHAKSARRRIGDRIASVVALAGAKPARRGEVPLHATKAPDNDQSTRGTMEL
jgi:hypothetical protein